MPEQNQSQTQPSPTPEQVEQQQIEQWVAKGLGAYPYISNKEQLDKLPDIGKQEIAQRFPEHYEYITADPNKLPADLRLRMSRQELHFDDIEHLTDAGFTAAVKFLEQRKKEFMQQAMDDFVQRQQEEGAAYSKAVQEQWAKSQAESLERANAAARAAYIRLLHSGSSVQQPTGPVTIGG